MQRLLFVLLILTGLNCTGQDTIKYTVRFPSAESILLETQLKSLDSIISILEGPINSFIYEIQGHTDNVGDRPYNLRLSEKRCQSIKAFLMKKGVKTSRISYEKYGFDLPLTENTTDKGRAYNRRATLTIIPKLDSPDWQLQPQIFRIDTREEIILTTKNGCKIGIPANAFLSSDLQPVSGKLEVQVTEYNNPADFIASGVPMSYDASGKLFMYHSYEMLNIKAFKNSTPLVLKDDISIMLNCKEVDSLFESGFYKFNLQEQKWFEDKRTETTQVEINKGEREESKQKTETTSTRDSNSEVKDNEKSVANKEKETTTIQPDLSVAEAKIIPESTIDNTGFESKFPELKIDTVAYDNCFHSNLFLCSDLKIIIAEGLKLSEKPLDFSYDKTWIKYFDECYSDFSYSGILKMDSEDPASIQKYYPIQIITKKKLFRKKATVSIKYDTDKNPELNELKRIKYSFNFKNNIEDYASFQERNFSDIRIKYDSLTNETVIELKEKDSFCSINVQPNDPDGLLQQKMGKYADVLALRKSKFDYEVQKNEISIVNHALGRYSCFWIFNNMYFATEEKGYSYKKWITYFNEHLSQIHARYDSLNTNLNQILTEFHCFDSLGTDSIKYLLKGNGNNRFLVIGLGIYNYDQVVPLQDIVSISSPQFFDKKGSKINVKESFLILGGINGMMHLDSKSPLRLIEKYRNTIFIVDQSNRRFKFVIEAHADIQHHGNSFIMQDITATTENLEGLEKELMGK